MHQRIFYFLFLLFALGSIEGTAQITPGDPGNFVTTWHTDSTTTGVDTNIIIRTQPGYAPYNYDIYWEEIGNSSNNGTLNNTNPNGVTITLPNAGAYRVEIAGDFKHMNLHVTNSEENKLMSIEQWGNIQWRSLDFAFYECNNMVYNATDVPDLSNASSTAFTFSDCGNFNGAIGNWDMSTITRLRGMFRNTSSFNQPLNNWDVSNVTDMRDLFRNATAFDQPLDNWDMANVELMEQMFRDATSFNSSLAGWNLAKVTSLNNVFLKASAFNQNINDWNVSNVESLQGTFREASSFNQPLSNWNVSSVTNMRETFYEASAFNQPLNNWDVSNVENLFATFVRASSFNQPLNNWNVGKVEDMGALFRETPFNQDINNWDVSKVRSINSMFHSSSFNQPLNNWILDSLLDMQGVFLGNTVFNQDLSSWDVSNVTAFGAAFRNATAFDQSLGDWDIGNANTMSQMLFNSGLSRNNYDATLIGWADDNGGTQTIPTDRSPFPQGLEYCAGEAARQDLIDNYNWSFNGDNLNCSPQVNTTALELQDVRVFPNPTRGTLQLELPVGEEMLELRVFNSLGQLVLQRQYAAQNYAEVQLEGPAGWYILHLQSADGKTYRQKVQKL